jgi:hypothetical protein
LSLLTSQSLNAKGRGLCFLVLTPIFDHWPAALTSKQLSLTTNPHPFWQNQVYPTFPPSNDPSPSLSTCFLHELVSQHELNSCVSFISQQQTQHEWASSMNPCRSLNLSPVTNCAIHLSCSVFVVRGSKSTYLAASCVTLFLLNSVFRTLEVWNEPIST